MEEFRSHPLYNIDTAQFDHLGKKCFDGIYVAAWALNCTDATLRSRGNLYH